MFHLVKAAAYQKLKLSYILAAIKWKWTQPTEQLRYYGMDQRAAGFL